MAKSNPVGLAILAHLSPKPGKTGMGMDDGADEGSDTEAVAQEIMSAIKKGDAKSLADSLESFFQICDAKPHEEGPHPEDDEAMEG